MTDNKIIKALKEILEIMCVMGDLQKSSTISNALDLINRKDEELNHLQVENKRLQNEIGQCDHFPFCNYNGCEAVSNVCWQNCPNSVYNTTKAEAYKEFAERVKKKIFFVNIHNCEKAEIKCIDLKPEHIDNILKELVGEK